MMSGYRSDLYLTVGPTPPAERGVGAVQEGAYLGLDDQYIAVIVTRLVIMKCPQRYLDSLPVKVGYAVLVKHDLAEAKGLLAEDSPARSSQPPAKPSGGTRW